MKRSRGKTIEMWFWAIASTGGALFVCTFIVAIIVERPHKVQPGALIWFFIVIIATWQGLKMFLSAKNSN